MSPTQASTLEDLRQVIADLKRENTQLWTCPVLVERHRVIRHWFFRTEPGL